MRLDDLIKRVDHKKQILDQSRPLPFESVQSLIEDFRLRFTHETTAIEGNTLSLRETQAVLEEGITVHGKSLREHLEVINANESLHYLEKIVKNKVPITERLIMQFHEILMKGILKEEAGLYRRIPVFIKGAKHIPPNWIKVPKLMADWEHWINESTYVHPVVLAAKAHIHLARIHPFVDGNGRTCRLLVNCVLMQHGYPPALYRSENRDAYMKALDDVENGNEDTFIQVTAEATEWTLDRYLHLLEETVPPEEIYNPLLRVHGRKVAVKSKCSDRCKKSKAPVSTCRCSCGGKNHGTQC